MSNKMSKMSIIELSWLGQDLFDFSGLTWAHPGGVEGREEERKAGEMVNEGRQREVSVNYCL